MTERLQRTLSLPGAVALGLGSILGTGIFVSVALAVGSAGVWAIPALLLAAAVASCNGMSSASLAAAHPVSGGTYEYAYRWLNPPAGFSAGWLFIAAKTASAAAAALGSSAYILNLAGADKRWIVPLAVLLIISMATAVGSGLRQSLIVNYVGLSLTGAALLLFVGGLAPLALARGVEHLAGLSDFSTFHPASLLQAGALLFVAYTGYARIATLGEEVREPRRTIPRAILITMWLAAILYVLVMTTGIASIGASRFGITEKAGFTPLAIAAAEAGLPGLPVIVSLGAVSAMLSVLLNLILGTSRVILAMSRRGDLPVELGRLNRRRDAAPVATAVVCGLVVALAGLGSIKLAWSFSALNVLLYYALTNLAALRQTPTERTVHPVVVWLGLAGCLSLAAFIEWQMWLAGAGLLSAGLAWHLWRKPQREAARSS